MLRSVAYDRSGEGTHWVFPWLGEAIGCMHESETIVCGNAVWPLALFTSHPCPLVSLYGPLGVKSDPDPHNLLGGTILSTGLTLQDISR
jgi:hypothetical protein